MVYETVSHLLSHFILEMILRNNQDRDCTSLWRQGSTQKINWNARVICGSTTTCIQLLGAFFLCVCVCACTCTHMHVCTHAQLCLTLCESVDYSPPGSSVMRFSREEYWNGLPFPTPEEIYIYIYIAICVINFLFLFSVKIELIKIHFLNIC